MTLFEVNQTPTTVRVTIVVSAVALVGGGMFTILLQCLSAAARITDVDFVFLVHDDKSLPRAPNVKYITFPHANRSYVRRLATEYWKFFALSKRLRPDIWLSLHDTTPRVKCTLQAVYCHNALPVFRPRIHHMALDPFESLRSYLYGALYKFRASKNTFIVAQLPWFSQFLMSYTGAHPDQMLCVAPDAVVCPKEGKTLGAQPLSMTGGEQKLTCFYPSLPRVYKNFEEAIALCAGLEATLWITVQGTENRYARYLKRNAGTHVGFLGRLSHADCLARMAAADVVLFPSSLESYGLPISEAMTLGKILVLPERPWTVEIAGSYERAYFYRNVASGRAILASLSQRKGPLPPPARPAATANPPTPIKRMAGFESFLRFMLERLESAPD